MPPIRKLTPSHRRRPPPPSTKQAFASLLRSLPLHPSHLKQLHALLLTTALSRSNSLLTRLLLSLTLLDHQMPYARKLFDQMPDKKPRVFLWNTLFRGYFKSRLPTESLALFLRMRRLGVRPDTFTFPFLLKSCAELLDSRTGETIHALLVRFGLLFDAAVATELTVMYAKLGDPRSADRLFDGSGDDLIAWNALITAYAQSGNAEKALSLFRRMRFSGVEPNSVTLVGALSACSYLGCLDFGKELRLGIDEQMLESNVFVGNALLDMYSKCGCMAEAEKLFEGMNKRNVVSWSTMIGGYAINGDSRGALDFLARMQEGGIRPNHITMLAVLQACSHAGLVSEGKKHFYRMPDPRIEHYATMVDLLGRSGYLREAYDFIEQMVIEPDAGVWGALLGACTIHRNTKIGQLAADRLLELAPEAPSYRVLLSNIYAASGRWGDVEKVRALMRGSNVKKVAGYSSTELNGEVHLFYEGSRTESKEIYMKLEELTGELRRMGYAPETGVVLHDVEPEEKEAAVTAHSEKLAIAFSLIHSKGSVAPLRIMKNLRICRDCHAFSKYASRAIGREIIMRDKNRFHRFKDGECSCRDFW